MKKSLTRTERGMLLRKKVLQGKPYDVAYKEVAEELTHLENLADKNKVEEKLKHPDFRKEFEKLRRRKNEN